MGISANPNLAARRGAFQQGLEHLLYDQPMTQRHCTNDTIKDALDEVRGKPIPRLRLRTYRQLGRFFC